MPAKQRNKYPNDWTEIAAKVKDDAGWRCARCYHTHEPDVNYCLTVHHFDGDKSNNARWNLMALCQRCHLSVQARVDPDIPLLTRPAPWSMPYIAGFYEAGRGMPSPSYRLKDWIRIYVANRGPWPAWAPMQQNYPKPAIGALA